MAGEWVVNRLGEMTYSGTKRYRGEIFKLSGALNDDNLIKVGHVKTVPWEYAEVEAKAVRDDTGRLFESDEARINFRRTAPRDVLIVRRPGRPRKVIE